MIFFMISMVIKKNEREFEKKSQSIKLKIYKNFISLSKNENKKKFLFVKKSKRCLIAKKN